jgi:hypothetical protein
VSGEVRDPIVIDLEDPYYHGQALPNALSDFSHVHSTTGVCVKNVHGHLCAAMSQYDVPIEDGEAALRPLSNTPVRELIVWENADLRASLARGLQQSATGFLVAPAQRDPLLCPGDGCQGCMHCHSDGDADDHDSGRGA